MLLLPNPSTTDPLIKALIFHINKITSSIKLTIGIEKDFGLIDLHNYQFIPIKLSPQFAFTFKGTHMSVPISYGEV